MLSAESNSLVNTVKSIPAINTNSIGSTEKFSESYDGPSTSILNPEQKDLNFHSISRRNIDMFRDKLIKIKNAKNSKIPDIFCALSSTTLGVILGSAFAGLTPLTCRNFILYFILTSICIGCGVAYFTFKPNAEINPKNIAEDLLETLPNHKNTD